MGEINQKTTGSPSLLICREVKAMTSSNFVKERERELWASKLENRFGEMLGSNSRYAVRSTG